MRSANHSDRTGEGKCAPNMQPAILNRKAERVGALSPPRFPQRHPRPTNHPPPCAFGVDLAEPPNPKTCTQAQAGLAYRLIRLLRRLACLYQFPFQNSPAIDHRERRQTAQQDKAVAGQGNFGQVVVERSMLRYVPPQQAERESDQAENWAAERAPDMGLGRSALPTSRQAA
jgi:hypothetical protein